MMFILLTTKMINQKPSKPVLSPISFLVNMARIDEKVETGLGASKRSKE